MAERDQLQRPLLGSRSEPTTLEKCKKYTGFILVFIEASLLAGAFVGWPSLVYVLQADGLYSSECSSLVIVNDTTASPVNGSSAGGSDSVVAQAGNRCPEQKAALAVPFTIITVFIGVSALPVGLFFDRFGLRTTRTITALVGCGSYLQLAFASPGTEWLLSTAAVGVGATSFTLIMTSAHVALLAGKHASTVIAIFLAGVNTSFLFQLIKILHDSGFPRRYSMLIAAGLWLLLIVSSWLFLPVFKVDASQQQNKDNNDSTSEDTGNEEKARPKDYMTIDNENENNAQQGEAKDAGSRPQSASEEEEKITVKAYVLSVTFILFLYTFSALQTRVNFLIAGYDAWMTVIVNNDVAKVSYFTDAMAYASLIGTICTPVGGIITDMMRRVLGPCAGGRQAALVPALLITSTFAVAMTIPLLIYKEESVWAIVVISALGKPLVYATVNIYMSLLAPMHIYGIVFGLANLVASVGSFMLYPYMMWVSAVNSFIPVNIFILVTMILTYALPIKLFYDYRKLTKEWERSQAAKGNLE